MPVTIQVEQHFEGEAIVDRGALDSEESRGIRGRISSSMNEQEDLTLCPY